ncbi:MAG: EAL domain-containing protein [Betaproteobacteria bacterium]|nr:EAL domain-containing protein [Betaproteobacteria bacterium]
MPIQKLRIHTLETDNRDTRQMHSESDPQKDIADRLLSALQEDEFVLYCQSIVSFVPEADGRAFNEIFVRFQEEDAKLLPPGTFFPVLEEVGMLPYLDRWVVNRLARFVRAGLKINPDWDVPRYIVNLSDETLADEEFGEYVLQYADDSYLSCGVLGFDISCDSAQANRESLLQLMEELRPHGCSLTVAGFDGSDASLAELKALEPDFVKISATAVDPARVPEINRMCHELGAQTIAEHVENSRVLDHLRRCKIDFGQGFGLAKVEPL